MNDMKKAWTDLPTWVQVVIGVFALLVVVTVAASGSNSSKKHTDTNQSAADHRVDQQHDDRGQDQDHSGEAEARS